MHAVVRGSHATVHFIGNVEPYDLETLGEHATAAAAHREGRRPVELEIRVMGGEEVALRQTAGRMLGRLEHDGVVVSVVADSSARPPRS